MISAWATSTRGVGVPLTSSSCHILQLLQHGLDGEEADGRLDEDRVALNDGGAEGGYACHHVCEGRAVEADPDLEEVSDDLFVLFHHIHVVSLTRCYRADGDDGPVAMRDCDEAASGL